MAYSYVATLFTHQILISVMSYAYPPHDPEFVDSFRFLSPSNASATYFGGILEILSTRSRMRNHASSRLYAFMFVFSQL